MRNIFCSALVFALAVSLSISSAAASPPPQNIQLVSYRSSAVQIGVGKDGSRIFEQHWYAASVPTSKLSPNGMGCICACPMGANTLTAVQPNCGGGGGGGAPPPPPPPPPPTVTWTASASIWATDIFGIVLWKMVLTATWTGDTGSNTITYFQNPGDDSMTYCCFYSMSIQQNTASQVAPSQVHYFAIDQLSFSGVAIGSPECTIDGYVNQAPVGSCK